jgi:hypothetical protein
VHVHKVTIYYNKPLNKIFIPWHNPFKIKSKDESFLPQKEIHIYVLKKKLNKENQQQIKKNSIISFFQHTRKDDLHLLKGQ